MPSLTGRMFHTVMYFLCDSSVFVPSVHVAGLYSHY